MDSKLTWQQCEELVSEVFEELARQGVDLPVSVFTGILDLVFAKFGDGQYLDLSAWTNFLEGDERLLPLPPDDEDYNNAPDVWTAEGI